MTDIDFSQPVGKVATTVPGAADLFRRHGISFCCGGSERIDKAAQKAGLSPDVLLMELQTLMLASHREAPERTAELIDHLRSRYHETHRSELAWLIPLAQKVERVHSAHPQAPVGLANLLECIQADLEGHMSREEAILFPLMEQNDEVVLTHPIAQMRHEHDVEARHLAALEHVTGGFTLPDGACNSWRALYTSAKKFSEDLVEHMHLENNVLFPRFVG
ncbi:MAG: iron-sulfur cluster repair di-iron protein [Alphaproteobacteria bacterium]|nr:iron-sulfur cluster repair di-iron protein [Rhizobiaceae bacterium]MBU3962803.1 iron-sulfur cluster repair di-iron protein [Alphaproteobacteria bacterium]MBU4087885.1 iron-sulfur cluster repair di-iron protein [Alphaproteobacteria bacterium]